MGHTNNLPRRPMLPGPAPEMPPLGFCVQCVADHKGALARLAATAVGEIPQHADQVPAIAPAIMLVGGTGCCVTHLVVKVESPLLIPTGAVPR